MICNRNGVAIRSTKDIVYSVFCGTIGADIYYIWLENKMTTNQERIAADVLSYANEKFDVDGKLLLLTLKIRTT